MAGETVECGGILMSNQQDNQSETNETDHNHNVDPAEIHKFGQMASRWWDPEGQFKPLHEINPLRLDFIDRHSALAGKRVLDVGCGGGILAEAMALRGAEVTGIDMGEAPLEVARLHALESGVSVAYRQITAEALAAEQSTEQSTEQSAEQSTKQSAKQSAKKTDTPTQWDIVCCLELLEHVPDPASVVSACADLVKPGGAVYFSTINRNPKSFLMAIVGAEYVLNLLPKGTHQYEKLIRPRELCNWCQSANLNITEITGMHYNPLNQTYSLGPGVDVNYLVFGTKT